MKDLNQRLKDIMESKTMTKTNPPVGSENYPMSYLCSNCGGRFTQTFEFGEIAEQGKCPRCGVTPWELRRRDEAKSYL